MINLHYEIVHNKFQTITFLLLIHFITIIIKIIKGIFQLIQIFSNRKDKIVQFKSCFNFLNIIINYLLFKIILYD